MKKGFFLLLILAFILAGCKTTGGSATGSKGKNDPEGLYTKTVAEKRAALEQIFIDLNNEEVDLYAFENYQLIAQEIAKADKLLNQNDAVGFQNQYERTLRNSQHLIEAVRTNKTLVEQAHNLSRQIAVESADPKAGSLLRQGEQEQMNYNLEGAYNSYTQIIKQDTLNKQQNAMSQELKTLETQLKKVQKEIESANKLFVIDENGKRIYPKEWKGDDYLLNNPLKVVVGNSTNNFKMEGLKPYTLLINLPADHTVVAADINSTTLYERAITLWQQGVQERNLGDLDAASNYFDKAMENIIEFKRGAVAKIYVVKYNPTLRDCLWRIASFKEIYDNKYLWPLIWQRNNHQITNPDLIYPNQELLIPPLLD